MQRSLPHRFLLSLPPETAHCLALQALTWQLKLGGAHPIPQRGSRQVMGLSFPNPVGLAAGFDKNGEHVDALANLGFGFIEVGGVTPKPQPGNPQPRIFRLTQAQALINRMGFNNVGAVRIADNLKKHHYTGIIGVNLGKNADTAEASVIDDYLTGLEIMYPTGDFFTVNISSPNTAGLRQWQYGDALTTLLSAVTDKRDQLANQYDRRAPIAVKIAPDLTDTELQHLVTVVNASTIDGVIACNTTVNPPDYIKALPHGRERGGLSGKPLAERTTAIIRKLRETLRDTIAIIGVGGIFTADDANKKMAAGADLVQIYTGLIYQGAQLPRHLINHIKTFV